MNIALILNVLFWDFTDPFPTDEKSLKEKLLSLKDKMDPK